MPLSFFRRRKQETREEAPPAAAVPAPTTESIAVATPAAENGAAGPDGQPSSPAKRRRGTRGGRNRKKKTDGAATAPTADAKVERAPAARKPAERKPADRQPADRQQADRQQADRQQADRQPSERKTRASATTRRRTAPKRAPLPKAKRELLISVDAGEKRVAVLEDDRVAEVYLERPERLSIAGNIYLGTVDNVLPGMEAAFVEIGLEKNGFLYVDEIVGPELEGRKSARKIQDLIQKGQTVVVQAVKDPMKTKGARLTTEVSLPGRFVVYVPYGEGLGVSRRIEDEERNRLKEILKEIAPKNGGVIVRTAAEGASAEDIERDLDFLERLWKTIQARAAETKAPALVYQEAELPLRVTRDLFSGDFERLLVDHERTHRRISGYLKKTSPHMAERVVRYKEREPLMDAFGVEGEIKSTLNRRVDLPSGGYLIFDYAEAFTVIDVNTGRFVGSRSKKSGARLEDTITKNNLEAVREVVRQLRLRDIGGIIVIDFIDMASPKNRAAVEAALGEELERDRTKTYVVEISPLGLVEMTRQNVTDGPREIMTKKCPTCGGDGIVVSEHTAAVDVERRLRALVTPGSRDKAFKVEVNARVASLVVGPGAIRLHQLEETTKRVFFLVGKPDVHLDHFAVLDRGTLEKVAPSSPLSVGQELELKLVELGLHDATAGVGKVDGIDVAVANAAKLVGRKVKARVAAVTDGFAWAELLDGVRVVDEPITAESEAEKPTRARRSSAPRKATDETGDVSELDGDAEEPVEDAAEPDEEAVGGEASADGGAPKKRTRRGSRGGRNRRKKTDGVFTADASGDATEATFEAETEAETGDSATHEAAVPDLAAASGAEPAEPARAAESTRIEQEPDADGTGAVIHLPERPAEIDGTDDAPKKRTRRGSRGGRNRKKKTDGAATNELGAAEPAALLEVDAADTNVSEPSSADEPGRERFEPEPAVVTEPAASTDPVASTETTPSENGARGRPEEADERDWGYTPMSEWGLDERER